MNGNGNEKFRYTYSAEEQEELKKIREKYTHREESKIERLRRLDKGVTAKAQIYAITFGVIGILILGFGMSLAMSDLSAILGSHRDTAMLFGIIIGIVGGAIASLAHPVYTFILKKERKKIAPEVLRLTDELLK